MCGIIGYTGSRQAVDIVLDGLDRLDYRGYDSAGLAVQNGAGLVVRKVSGSVGRLRASLGAGALKAHCGIGHTRWATHGAPSEANAHPHTSCCGRIGVVHNGVIENADALRSLLKERGHAFRSDTDSEILAHLIEDYPDLPLEEAVGRALDLVEGTYGLAVVHEDEPTKIVVARSNSPVVLGIGEHEYFLASDPAAVLAHTRRIVHLRDGDLATVTPEGYRITDRSARVQTRLIEEMAWSPPVSDLGIHSDYMHKEIFEQPAAVARAFAGRPERRAAPVGLAGLELSDRDIRRIDRILMVACGTSWHACLVARYMIQELSGIPVAVEYASEFRYLPRSDLSTALTVAVSQSGETADTLEAAREAHDSGARLLSVVNVVGSTLDREADWSIHLEAGPEIGVASTKAFTSQVATLLLLAMRIGSARGSASAEIAALGARLDEMPAAIERALALEDEIEALSRRLQNASSCLFMGRGVSFPVALEGALKLKEISYVHAEGYPAAEMKHGPIALIDHEMPVVCVAPLDTLFPKMLVNIQEVRARGAQIVSITSEGCSALDSISDHVLRVPETPKLLSPLVTVIPLQLLAYHIAVLRGRNVDRPRNLAKCVTVE
jgi:glucosamine--fructose-6-phosphate aminotransferase (isomerizing)